MTAVMIVFPFQACMYYRGQAIFAKREFAIHASRSRDQDSERPHPGTNVVSTAVFNRHGGNGKQCLAIRISRSIAYSLCWTNCVVFLHAFKTNALIVQSLVFTPCKESVNLHPTSVLAKSPRSSTSQAWTNKPEACRACWKVELKFDGGETGKALSSKPCLVGLAMRQIVSNQLCPQLGEKIFIWIDSAS
ncbi:conserved hypothetical protein [Coccidioides posadasii str. Silveira]|uniref:Uncharacterized protein n=1 Tax=Coccidioides posadasii (strain RMSCC 757 / Silveira) TaxID=443226 RepID=E9D3V4_COCPS|nr:conserved hypothetical protein [Coccidioides posadasii str. Silveira]